jgi:hypothetical protein
MIFTYNTGDVIVFGILLLAIMGIMILMAYTAFHEAFPAEGLPIENHAVDRAIKLLETTRVSCFVNKRAGRRNWEEAQDEVHAVIEGLRNLTLAPPPAPFNSTC